MLKLICKLSSCATKTPSGVKLCLGREELADDGDHGEMSSAACRVLGCAVP